MTLKGGLGGITTNAASLACNVALGAGIVVFGGCLYPLPDSLLKVSQKLEEQNELTKIFLTSSNLYVNINLRGSLCCLHVDHKQ